MKKLNKVFAVLLFAVALMLILTVNTSAVVEEAIVTDAVKAITFDAEYYLSAYSDLRVAFGTDGEAAYDHFLTYGIREGRCAKLTFNVVDYLNAYDDLKAAFGNDYEAAYKHFIEYGAREGRSGCKIYDPMWYSSYSDLKAAFGNDKVKYYEHYAVDGVKEGRVACNWFDARCYLARYSDLTAAFTATGYEQAFRHFLEYGIAEGREGTHVYTRTTVEPTCTEDGYILEECACGDTVKTPWKKTGHKMVATEAKSATCTTEGNNKYYTCENCKKVFKDEAGKTETTVKSETIAALGHSWGDAEEATGEEPENSNNYVHKHTCTRCEKTEYFDEAHSYGEEPVSTTATCTAGGEETCECTVCGKEDVREAQALGHAWDEGTVTIEPTCTEKGEMTYTCTRDNCEETKTEEIAAIGHNYVLNEGKRLTATKPATCATNGFDEYVCENCGTTRLVAVKATGKHTLTKAEAKEATCTETGNKAYYRCTVCDKYFEDEAGKTEIEKDSVVVPAAHKIEQVSAVAETCTTDGNKAYYRCTVCDKYFEDEAGKIEIEKDSVVVPAAHKIEQVSAVVATCETDGNKAYYKCTVCDKYFEDEAVKKEITDKTSVVIPASEEYHAWAAGDPDSYGLTAPTCTEAGYTVQVCSICEAVELTEAQATGHNYKYTDNEDGTHKKDCLNETSDEVNEDHTFGEAVASETYQGLYEKTCTACGNTKYYTTVDATEEVIPVSTLDELKNAISGDATAVVLSNDITGIGETVAVNKTMKIYGNSHKLQFSELTRVNGVASALVIMADNTVVNDLTVEMTAQEGWQGNYAVQAYDVEGVVLNNLTAANGDAGILVNASKVELTGTTTLNNNEFGGIEVSKGTAEGLENSVLTVTGTISMNNEAEEVPVIWIEKDQGTVTGTGAEDYILKERDSKNQIYYYLNPNFATMEFVNNIEDLKAAISNQVITRIILEADITGITETLSVNKTMKIYGNSHKLQFSELTRVNGVASALVIMADNTVVNDLTVEMTAQEGWQGNYAVQAYDVEGVVLNNLTAANGDAGILVNASKVELTGTTTLTDNEFGGIEVSKGSAEGLENSVLTVTGEISMNNEAYAVPVIWIEAGEGQGTASGAGISSYYSTTETNNKGKTFYYTSESVAQQQ